MKCWSCNAYMEITDLHHNINVVQSGYNSQLQFNVVTNCNFICTNCRMVTYGEERELVDVLNQCIKLLNRRNNIHV